jgi:hypothetical protein
MNEVRHAPAVHVRELLVVEPPWRVRVEVELQAAGVDANMGY